VKIVITGGAGFVGSHLVDLLVARGDDVIVYDTLIPQVHVDGPPTWLHPGARYVIADPRCERFLEDSRGADALVHLAAATGTGQSMYQAAGYTRDNAELTAALSDLLVERRLEVGRVVFTSSRAVYGEGAVRCPSCGVVHPGARVRAHLQAQQWQPSCPSCGGPTTWAATTEDAPLRPVSVYGATKQYGEQVLQLAAADAGVPVTILRPFNLYGARQTPGNPYVGVVAVFAAAVEEGRALTLFEDGDVIRDFCHVSDAARAVVAALDRPQALCDVLNIGSGQPTSLRELAAAVIAASGGDPTAWPIAVNGQTRSGDLRCCVADVQRADDLLGWRPLMPLDLGLVDVLDYVRGRPAADIDAALDEMARRGLLIGGSS
jgi:dTDP-L-rhamnose 4-epimerase